MYSHFSGYSYSVGDNTEYHSAQTELVTSTLGLAWLSEEVYGWPFSSNLSVTRLNNIHTLHVLVRPNYALCTRQAETVTVQRTADTVIPHSHPTKVGQAVRLVTLQSTDDSVVHPQELFSG